MSLKLFKNSKVRKRQGCWRGKSGQRHQVTWDILDLSKNFGTEIVRDVWSLLVSFFFFKLNMNKCYSGSIFVVLK